MNIKLYFILSCVIYLTVGALADDEIKRGTYPFMAFIYYQDETILGRGGGRFLQGAVLVRSNFLISSSLESTISNDPLSKTLLARFGSTTIDPKLTLNEDEEEQEQEIIQITRPYEHVGTRWWLTDICLLKTLQPVTMNNFVHFTQLSTKQEVVNKVCYALVFAKKGGTDTRALTRLFVEMLPATEESCGEKFVSNNMRCATDQPTVDGTTLSPDFCQGNNGGPLICGNDVIALQTYIENDCKAPHLYQLLSPRKRFLDCGIEEKCDSHCDQVCTVIHKDPQTTIMPTTSATSTTSETVQTELTSESTESTVLVASSEDVVTSSSVMPTNTNTPSKSTESTSISTTLPTPSTTSLSTTETRSWPIERGGRKMHDDKDALNQSVSVEAQSQPLDEKTPKRYESVKPVNRASTTDIFMIVFQSFIYSGSLCVLS